MRLGLKYPVERVALSWDFTDELQGKQAVSVRVAAMLDPKSPVKDPIPESTLFGETWIERNVPMQTESGLVLRDVVFQLVKDGLHGADYRFRAVVVREDGLVFAKQSVLPVREG